ncbi:MAG TPA: ADP-ribosylglycohydrolase family protein [Thermomicrobiales bacterium]|nr:ADP-ribosylglycohydrolase family protein [Thermomicrobiales bacterium]
MIDQPTTLDRALGVMLGLACGDALGAPVEFESRVAITARYPDGLRDFTTGGWLSVERGELTDDSRMAIDLAEVLIIPGLPDMEALADRFVAWVAEDPKDVGNTTRLAIGHLAAGVPWQEAGAMALATMGSSHAASNGSIMRTAPVAVRFAHQPEQLIRASLDTSRITHAEPRCQWSSVAYNQALAHLLNGGEIDSMLEAADTSIDDRDVRAAIAAIPNLQEKDLRGTGFVLNALQIALWAVRTQPTLEEAIVSAVMVGDDTDTNAAVTGALAGARWGAAAIPGRWLDLLQQRERLTSLAESLFAASQSA